MTAWATWIDLPESTAVVLVDIDDRPSLWQRPRGETVFFDLGEMSGGELRLAALDATGAELAFEDVIVFDVGP